MEAKNTLKYTARNIQTDSCYYVAFNDLQFLHEILKL
jgi:hypothetical protein